MKKHDEFDVIGLLLTIFKWTFLIAFGLLWVLFVLLGDKSKNRD